MHSFLIDCSERRSQDFFLTQGGDWPCKQRQCLTSLPLQFQGDPASKHRTTLSETILAFPKLSLKANRVFEPASTHHLAPNRIRSCEVPLSPYEPL